jgi:hypothetical protein
MTSQSTTNLTAVSKPTLKKTVDEYEPVWPTAYPALLWSFSHLGLPVRLFNLLCFVATLWLLWVFTSEYLPSVHPAVPVVLLAILHLVYPNLH